MATQKQITANRNNAKKAGRPKGKISLEKISKEKAASAMRDKILKKWMPLIEAKLDLALGVYLVRKLNGKEERIYKQKPDSASLEFLFATIIGKPRESVDMNVSGLEQLTASIQTILKK